MNKSDHAENQDARLGVRGEAVPLEPSTNPNDAVAQLAAQRSGMPLAVNSAWRTQAPEIVATWGAAAAIGMRGCISSRRSPTVAAWTENLAVFFRTSCRRLC